MQRRLRDRREAGRKMEERNCVSGPWLGSWIQLFLKSEGHAGFPVWEALLFFSFI